MEHKYSENTVLKVLYAVATVSAIVIVAMAYVVSKVVKEITK